uniref:Dynein regulatory complex subunit 7-like n=1 Tax=Sinocyclocheilus grahami TaxID=75366 RepID=A0A672NI22_SINGR
IAKPSPQVAFSKCSSSYKENNSQEKLMLAMAENFRQQYALLYPDHKALLLCPVNECGVQKFVSTTLRSTLLPYSELYDWGGCASFVADYLALELLDPPFELLSSPSWVLQTQRGTCFDFSIVLCSLLLGAGYNAYCVSGYATKEMCLLDQSRQECPLLQPQIQVKEPKKPIKKYSVKPPRDLQSNFERRQEEKQQAEAEAAALKKQLDAERLQKEREHPPPDPLRGLRVHCWVLLLSGNREIPENFFIDPLTSKSYSTTNENFLGIESVWNHQNYWVNKQDCTFGCNEMTFDLGDLSKWEYVLCGQSLSIISDPKTLEEPEDEEEVQNEEMDELKVFEMPPSWVTKIDISPADMEMRYPGGMKVIEYRKAKLEKFAPYLLKDGLVTKLTTYKDLDCKIFADASVFSSNIPCHHVDHVHLYQPKKCVFFQDGTKPSFGSVWADLCLVNKRVGTFCFRNMSKSVYCRCRHKERAPQKARKKASSELVNLFVQETEELQKKQLWYQKNYLTMSNEDEDDYLAYCSDAMFRIHVLKMRLIRHKERAPQKYLALEEKLKRHPRLASHLL